MRLAWRNGAVMLLQNPIFSLLVAVALALLWWLSPFLVVVNLLAGPVQVALVGSHAVSDRPSRHLTGSSIPSEQLMSLNQNSLSRVPRRDDDLVGLGARSQKPARGKGRTRPLATCHPPLATRHT